MEEKQNKRISLSLAAMGIAGTLVGALAPQALTSLRETRTAFLAQQREAYVGYLNSLDDARMAVQMKDRAKEESSRAATLPSNERRVLEKKAAEDEATANKLNLDFERNGGAALRRIGIYGEKSIVEKIAEWSRRSTTLGVCGQYWKKDLAIWAAMREVALGAGQTVSERDLGELTLYCRPDEWK
jgi:hypothetical protein